MCKPKNILIDCAACAKVILYTDPLAAPGVFERRSLCETCEREQGSTRLIPRPQIEIINEGWADDTLFIGVFSVGFLAGIITMAVTFVFI